MRKIETKSVAFLQLMSEEGHEEEAVVNSVAAALASKQKYCIHLAKDIIENEGFIPMLPCHYENQMYKELQHKFCSWLCLQELAIDRIRKIEFCPASIEEGNTVTIIQAAGELWRTALSPKNWFHGWRNWCLPVYSWSVLLKNGLHSSDIMV